MVLNGQAWFGMSGVIWGILGGMGLFGVVRGGFGWSGKVWWLLLV